MTNFKGFFRSILISTALFCAGASAEGFEESAPNGLRYGPNLSWHLMGNTPCVWGEWLPQAVGSVHYTWLEPLDQLSYGESLGAASSYWRLDAAVDLSPFYGGYQVGIGVRPFKSKIQFELNATYISYLYFRSNLEMVTSDVEGSGKIAETWNADYITNNVWETSSGWDYAQLFDFSATFSYTFPHSSLLGFNLHYIRSDVSTDFDGKSYDYRYNIPVFSRDFLVVLESFGSLRFSQNMAMVFEANYYWTGYLRSGNTVQKESLSYFKILAGPHFSWDNGLQNITVEVGGWKRGKKNSYNGSFTQQFLIQLEYQGYFSFPFHRNLSE